MSMYNQKKKKREVDPNAPPRPTLLGHEKEMKGWRQQISSLTDQLIKQQTEIGRLNRKIQNLETQLNTIVSYINRNS